MAYESMQFAVGFNAEYGGIQNSLFHVQKKLDKTMEALSTGKRVNDMKDDEGGMAIADTMKSWKTGTDESIHNLKEFLTMTKIAEKALDDIQDVLFQMKQTVDRLNGIEDGTDRSAAQAQLTELASAINKIAQHTEYKGFKLFNMADDQTTVKGAYLMHTVKFDPAVTTNGPISHSDRYIRYGAGAEDFLSWDLGMDPRAQQLGMVMGMKISTDNLSSFYFNGKNIGEIARQQGLDLGTKEGKITAIREALGENVKVDISTAGGNETIYIQTPGDFTYATGATGATHWIRSVLFETYEKEFTGSAKTTRLEGSYASVGTDDQDATTGVGVNNNKYTGVVGNRQHAYYFTNATVGTDVGATGTAGVIEADEGLFDINVTTNEAAALARVQVEAAINQINELRGVLSAMQHQAESLINQRMEESVGAEAQISHIMDTDYAKELANFTQQQIAQQAGVNMLSQKRQMAQLITQLLR